MENKIINTILHFIEKNKLINKNDNVGISASGGPDSTFLVYTINALRENLNINKIIILHFNHKIRGSASDKDELFVKTLCDNLNLQFYSEAEDVLQYVKLNKLSIEEGARKKRYAFLKRTKHEFDLQKIALGHTKDDLIETFLMNTIRGSGLDGLTSLKPIRSFFIRPLLCIQKNDILHYLHENNIKFMIDKTNYSDEYTRNDMRINLINKIKKYNPNIINTLANQISLLMDDADFINKVAEKNSLESMILHKGYLTIDIQKLSIFQAIRSRVIMNAIKRLLNENYSIGYDNIKRILDVLDNKNKTVVLRKKIKAYVKNSKLIIEKL